MQLTHLTILLSMTLALSSAQKLTPNAVASLLQGILSSKNTEQAIQMLSSAANKKRELLNTPGTATRRYVIADNIPRTARIEDPNKITYLVQNPKEICTKKNVVIQNSNNVVQRGNQMVIPKSLVVQQRAEKVLPKNVVVQQRTEMVLPKNVMIQNGGEAVVSRNVIVRNEIPQMLVQNNDFVSGRQIRPEMQQKVLISQPKVTEYMTVPQQKVLVRNENSFLPAASPISALTASSALPQAMPKSRGQFLRKIPIPPPTL